jgi:hypothetical protein
MVWETFHSVSPWRTATISVKFSPCGDAEIAGDMARSAPNRCRERERNGFLEGCNPLALVLCDDYHRPALFILLTVLFVYVLMNNGLVLEKEGRTKEGQQRVSKDI